MAEGFLKSFDSRLKVNSAGTYPSGKVHPKAIEVMGELNLDIKNNFPKDVSVFLNDKFDYVITVCGNAQESCPVFSGAVGETLHIGFEDPAEAIGTDEEIMNTFREIRDLIKRDFYSFFITEIREKL